VLDAEVGKAPQLHVLAFLKKRGEDGDQAVEEGTRLARRQRRRGGEGLGDLGAADFDGGGGLGYGLSGGLVPLQRLFFSVRLTYRRCGRKYKLHLRCLS
jgi:hypothetical protein